DCDSLRLVEVLLALAFAAEPAEELAAGLVEDLHPGVQGVGREELAALREREVLDVFELALAGAFRADVHDGLELHLGGSGRKQGSRQQERGPRSQCLSGSQVHCGSSVALRSRVPNGRLSRDGPSLRVSPAAKVATPLLPWTARTFAGSQYC